MTAFALARADGLWLMIRQRRLDVVCWELPGGHVQVGESLEECAARETHEETGVEIHVGRVLATCLHEWEERRQRRLICFFEASAASGACAPRIPPEPQIIDVAWIDPTTLCRPEVSAFLWPLLDEESAGWCNGPLHYRAEHARMNDGTVRPRIVS